MYGAIRDAPGDNDDRNPITVGLRGLPIITGNCYRRRSGVKIEFIGDNRKSNYSGGSASYFDDSALCRVLNCQYVYFFRHCVEDQHSFTGSVELSQQSTERRV